MLDAVQNLSVLLMALSCIPPAEFYRLVFAVAEALARTAVVTRDSSGPVPAPGLTGLYGVLHDEQLWRAIHPLAEGLKAFAAGLERRVESPISDFTGKAGRTN